MKSLVLLVALAIFTAVEAQAACSRVHVNGSGISGQDISVGATAVTVQGHVSTQCGGVILNSGTAPMRCAPAGLPVSGIQGFPVAPGASIVFGSEGQEEWRCIRTTGVSTTASVLRAVP